MVVTDEELARVNLTLQSLHGEGNDSIRPSQ